MGVDLTIMPTVAVHRSLGAVLGIPMPEVSIVFWPKHRPSAYSLDRCLDERPLTLVSISCER